MKNVGKAAREGRTAGVLADTVERERRRADEQDRRYRENAARQAASITRFVEFLQERDLMGEFNSWSDERNSSKEQTDGN